MENKTVISLMSLAVSGLLLAQELPARAQVQVNSGAQSQVDAPAAPTTEVQVNTPAQPAAPAPTVVNNVQATDRPVYGTRPGRGLMIGGATLFGTTYIATILGAAIASDVCNADSSLGCREASWPIYLPVIGPFIQMGYISGSGANTGRAVLAIDGALQATGLAMFIAGAVVWGASGSHPRYAQRVQIAPYSTAGGSGLIAFGRF